MNIKALQRRLSAFHVLRKPADDDGSDLGGEVIDATNPDTSDAPGADEDRGDNFTPTTDAAPAPAAPAAVSDCLCLHTQVTDHKALVSRPSSGVSL